MTITLNGLAGAELDHQLAALASRLQQEFPSREDVHQVISEERQRFADARIQSFLPILIERSARSRLMSSG
jgi:hypothetical protein